MKMRPSRPMTQDKFRDPFSISLVKTMLEDSILIPIVIVGFGRLLAAACSESGNGVILVTSPQAEGA